jgi:glyoxylase-like metal-dependent hydrolase (beta-lactamase superfamily II)
VVGEAACFARPSPYNKEFIMNTPLLARRHALSLAAAIVTGGTLLLAGCATQVTVDATATIARAEAAMGGAGLKTLRFAGTGSGGTFGQAYVAATPWPKITYSKFSRALDFETAAMRQDTALSRAEPNGGGAVPLMGTGEQVAVAMLQGDWAWNLAGAAVNASPVALDGRVHDLWTSPHGVLKAALKNKATATTAMLDGKTYTALSFAEPGRFSAIAYVNADGMVERVDSRQPSPVMGDTESTISYSGYKDFGGVKFPTRIRQFMGGADVLDIKISEVQANVPAGVPAPDAVKQFKENVVSAPAADGVWFLSGGSHNSVLIEMKDYTVLVEAPLYDARSAAVLAEARRLAPGKPVRYVINSHHHFDHGGLRTAVAEGLTLITSSNSKPWFEKTFANANSINRDALAKSGRSATIESVNGKRVLTDGVRTVEISEIQNSVHAQGFMMVYLPKEKILVEADAYTPGPPNAPAPALPNGNNLNLVQNIEQNKLAVDKILPLHGRMVATSELMTAVGRK